jgi:two-component system response regulator YesN
MNSLLIVDDEPIVLKAISHVVDAYCPAIKVVGQTGSGIEAVSIALREKPDIVMADIELVGLNGLEAVEEIKKALPETVFIIVSAYDNFHYAKRSISLGVIDYLLKPVSKDDLVNVLKKAVVRLETHRGKTREQLELRDKLSKIKPFLEEELFFALYYPGNDRHLLQDYPRLLDLEFAFGQAVEVHVEHCHHLIKNFDYYKQILKRYLTGAKAVLFGPVIGPTSFVMLGYDTVPNDQHSQWERIRQSLQTELEMAPGIVLGQIKPGIEGMLESFRELRLIWQNIREPRVFLAVDLPKPDRFGTVFPWKIEQDFFEAMKLGQSKLAHLVFAELYREMETTLGTDLQALKDYFQGIIAVLRHVFYESAPEKAEQIWKSGEFIRQIGNIADPGELPPIFAEIIDKLTGLITNGVNPEKNPEIRAAVEYMKQNYHRDLSLTGIAMEVAISPGYLSKLFKEYRNQTVMDFLERIRIEQALKLLNESGLSIKEIAGKVGFKDPNYFSKVFKKVTHTSPSEFRG